MTEQWIEVKNDNFVVFDTIGQTLIGIYLGSEYVEGRYGKKQLHKFQVKEDIKLVNGTTVLDNKLRAVKLEERTRLTYLGITRGVKPYHDYKVEYSSKPTF